MVHLDVEARPVLSVGGRSHARAEWHRGMRCGGINLGDSYATSTGTALLNQGEDLG